MIENANVLLTVILAVPLLGLLFAAVSKENASGIRGRNVLSVGIFTVMSNLVVLWITARKTDFSEAASRLAQKI